MTVLLCLLFAPALVMLQCIQKLNVLCGTGRAKKAAEAKDGNEDVKLLAGQLRAAHDKMTVMISSSHDALDRAFTEAHAASTRLCGLRAAQGQASEVMTSACLDIIT